MKKAILSLTLFVAFALTSNLFAQDQQLTAPSELKFTEMVHNFGKIKEVDGQVTCTFEFTNITKTPITVVGVKASCGCTTPDWTKEPVAPGKKGFVKATYNPTNRPGKFSKSITCTTSTGGTTVLKIEGEVEPKPVEAPEAQ